MPDVFVSYSRRDGEFVRGLVTDLEAHGKTVWLDTQGIEDGAVFPEAIRRAIEESDSFLFVITPESAASKYCGQEVDYALELQKRIVPVLRLPVGDDDLPEAIRVRNWIPYTPDTDAEVARRRVAAALDADLGHAQSHTRWLVKAVDWDTHSRDSSFLLRGSELADAEAWLAGVTDGADPAVTAVQREYLYASRNASSRRQRLIVGASLTTVVLALGLAVFALISRSQAQTARNQAVAAKNRAIAVSANAQSRALAAESETQLGVDPERSILLAVAAEHTRYTPEATYALRRAIDLSPIRGRLPSVGPQSEGQDDGPGIAYSPDGKQIAEGSQTGVVLLINRATLRVEQRLQMGSAAPTVAYSPSGSLLAVGTDKGTVLLNPTMDTRQGFIARMTNALDIQFSRDGRFLAEAEGDPSTYLSHLDLWNTHTHHLRVIGLPRRFTAAGGLDSVGFSPDGRRIVVGSSFGLGVFTTATGRLVATALSNRSVYGARYSPDGSLIAVAADPLGSGSTGGAATVELFDARTLKRKATIFTSHDGMVYQTEFSPDGTRVAYISGNGTLGVYSLETHRTTFQSPLGSSLSELAFSPDGGQVAVTGIDGSGGVYRASGDERSVIDVGENTNYNLMALTQKRVAVTFTPVSGRYEGVRIARSWRWSGRPSSPSLVIAHDQSGFAGIDTAGGLVVSEPGEGRAGATRSPIKVWGIGSRRVVKTLHATGEGEVTGPHFSPDGSLIVAQVADVADYGPTALDLINIATGRTTLLGKATCSYFDGDAISPNDKTVVAVDGCGHLTRWTVTAHGVAVHRLPGRYSPSADALWFSPDGSSLAIANAIGDGDIRLINPSTGRGLVSLVGQTQAINNLAYSPDGSLIATASNDGTTKVWDAHTGRLLRTINDGDPVLNLAFSPDSRTLATIDSIGILRLWDACTDCENPSALLALAKTRVTRQLTAAEKQTYLR